MPNTVQKIVSKARKFSKKSTPNRYRQFECLKAELLQMELPHQEYQSAVRKIADALHI